MSNQNLKMWIEIVNAMRYVQSQLRTNLRKDFGLTLPKFQVMAQLANNPDGLKMGAIASSLLLSAGNVTGIVERLVDDGLVARHAAPHDRRTVSISMTFKGQAYFDEVMARYRVWVDDAMKGLSSEVRAVVIDAMQELQSD